MKDYTKNNTIILCCGYWSDIGGKCLTEAEVKRLFQEGLVYPHETIYDWLTFADWEYRGFSRRIELTIGEQRIDIPPQADLREVIVGPLILARSTYDSCIHQLTIDEPFDRTKLYLDTDILEVGRDIYEFFQVSYDDCELEHEVGYRGDDDFCFVDKNGLFHPLNCEETGDGGIRLTPFDSDPD